MSKKYDFDYLVIGSGAAGGTAAMMAAGAGLKTALVEANQWGGSNANYRDVPYAASLHFAELYAEAVRGARFGLSSTNLRYNYPTVSHWRTVAAKRAGAGSKKDFEEAGVTCVQGFAHFVSDHEIAVGDKGRVSAAKFLIATGTVPKTIKITGVSVVSAKS